MKDPNLKLRIQKYMLEMIEERKGSAVLEERRDLLSNLIRASLEKNDSPNDFEFTHRDLLGNIFILLIGGKLLASSTLNVSLSRDRGQESTASALSFAIALLATHQEEQEELYKHVRSVVPDGRLPVCRGCYHDICSLYPVRPITTFRGSLGFLRSSMRHYGFSLLWVPSYMRLQKCAHDKCEFTQWVLGGPAPERGRGGLCDPNGIRETSPGSQRDNGSAYDRCYAP
jgi:hypothetical protein